MNINYLSTIPNFSSLTQEFTKIKDLPLIKKLEAQEKICYHYLENGHHFTPEQLNMLLLQYGLEQQIKLDIPFYHFLEQQPDIPNYQSLKTLLLNIPPHVSLHLKQFAQIGLYQIYINQGGQFTSNQLEELVLDYNLEQSVREDIEQYLEERMTYYATDTQGSWGLGVVTRPITWTFQQILDEAILLKVSVIVKPSRGKYWYLKGTNQNKSYMEIKDHLEENLKNGYRKGSCSWLI